MSLEKLKSKFSIQLSSAWLVFWFGLALVFSNANIDHQLHLTLHGPALFHPFGFDAFGRDMLSLVLKASAKSAAFAGAATLISTVIAIVAGLILSMSTQVFRFLFLRTLELFLAFPPLLLALTCAVIRGPGWGTLFISLLIGTLPPFIRLMYARSLELLTEGYVLAAQSLGADHSGIAINHLLPGLLDLCAIKVPGLFAQALIAEATLSFLGLGAPIGHDTWGSLLAQGKDYLLEAPHLCLASGLPLVLTTLALQLISERLAESVH